MGIITDITNISFTSKINSYTEVPTLNFTVELSENFSNATTISLLYWLVNNNQTWITLNRFDLTQPFTASIELSKFATSGYYEIRSIRASENSSGLVEYSSSQIQNEFGLNTSTFLDNPNSDNQSPVLVSLEVGNTNYNLDGILIPFSITASDDISGLKAGFVIELTSPSGKSIQQWCYFNEAGEFSGNFHLPKDSTSGDYKINTIRVFDVAGNSNFFQGWLSENTTPINIDNPNADLLPPDLNDFILTAAFDPETGRPKIVISGNSEDTNSGVSGVFIRMYGPTGSVGNLDTWVYYNPFGENSVNFENYKTLSSQFLPGLYTVDFLRIDDKAGNQFYLNKNQLDNLGFSSSINVIYQELINTSPIIGTDNNDYIFGSNSADDLLIGGGGNDKLFSGDGNDELYAGSGDDVVNAGDGNDLIVGGDGAGNDNYIGGAGVDTVKYTSATAGITVNLSSGMATSRVGINTSGIGNDTFSEIENIIAGNYDDLLTGDSNDNNFQALSGHDVVNGGMGNDNINGGAGNDTAIYSGNDNQYVITNNDNGTWTVQDNVANRDGTDTVSNIEFLQFANKTISLTAAPPQTLTGTSSVNTLTGGAGNDILIGLGGTDILNGAEGSDLYVMTSTRDHTAAEINDNGTSGTDAVRFTTTSPSTLTLFAGDRGIETVVIGTGTASSAVTTGTTANNINASAVTNALSITGNNGNNSLTGTAFNDTLIGNAGNDILNGGVGADTLIGGIGNDTYVIDNIGDLVTENLNEGTDLIQSIISYALGGNLENLTLTGTSNINGTGNALVNTITGNSGNNILDGAGGIDALVGGAGHDTYIVDVISATGLLQDTMTEGSNAGIDTIQLRGTYSGVARSITLATNFENLDISSTGSSLYNITGNAVANNLIGNSANNTINAGKGADTLTGGSGRDTFVFATGDSGQTATTLDKITDYTKGALGTSDLIDFTSNLTIGGSAATATTSQASINMTTGLATFAAGSGTTLSDAILDIASRMTAATNTRGEFALFKVNNTGDYYAFISDGTSGVGTNDVVIQLVGITFISSINLTAGNLTLVA